MDELDNPYPIQPDPPELGWGEPTPLILFHDGGGTIFSYHMLGDLDRAVWGISNPHYNTENTFAGGIPEMAQHYVGMMRKAIPRGGKVILGGWSLGGLTSLEVSRILAEKGSGFTVLGIVMIDSICPTIWQDPEAARKLKMVADVVQWDKNTKEETRAAVSRCFKEASRMAISWKLPVWGNGTKPPPVMLLKAKEYVPLDGDKHPPGSISRVDVFREDRQLGWGNYRADLVKQVVELPAHHFNIFKEMWRLDVVTSKIRRACEDIEQMASS